MIVFHSLLPLLSEETDDDEEDAYQTNKDELEESSGDELYLDLARICMPHVASEFISLNFYLGSFMDLTFTVCNLIVLHD